MAQRSKLRHKAETENGSLDLFAGAMLPAWVAIPKSVSEARPFVSILDLRRIAGLISDKIYAAHGHDRLRLFDTLLILLATKIYDELHSPDALQLSAFLSADGNLLEQVQGYAREALAAMNCEGFPGEMDLTADALQDVLALLGRYSLVNTLKIDPQAEVLGTFYQEIVSSTFRGSLGAYFTPKPVADLAAAFCRPALADTIFDISCGSATFLLSAYRAARPVLGTTGPTIFGNDIQERMVLTSALNCTLHQVKNAYFTHNDGLKIDLTIWHSQNRAVPKEGFSLIVGNPPFAGFDMLASGESSKGNGTATRPRLHKIIPFIRKVVDLLAPDGRAALVVPTSVLNAEAVSFRELRDYLARTVTVTALVNLPRDAFVHTDCGVEGALLFFAKRVPRSAERTFFGTVRGLGYDRRGHQNKQGTVEELLAAWERDAPSDLCWIRTQDLYQLERWDVPWLHAWTSGMLRFSEKTHVRLTDLCSVVRRTFSRRTVAPAKEYTYFEVGDADIDHGTIKQVHRCTGKEILRKGRLKLCVRAGDVLLPNHRDSLIAKTAAGVGRSAVRIGKELEDCITTDRFTPLEAKIDPNLLIAILNSGLVRRQLEVHARGSASFDIRDKVLHEVWVPRSLVKDPQTAKRLNKLFQIRERLRKRLERTAQDIEALIDDYSNRGDKAHRV
ncbi:MAG TPA: N-6 DNA methylase [Gemmataceae bacterium]|jgi:SAM-dependent methyltransferase